MAATWTPSNATTLYDRARVGQLSLVSAEIQLLALPFTRFRKLASLVNTLEAQIEDGGDSPEVNRLLLEALRAGILHQVDASAAEPVLRAIERFEAGESERWEQVREGTLPEVQGSLEEQLAERLRVGADYVERDDMLEGRLNLMAGVEAWLQAWELLKALVGAELQSLESVQDAYPEIETVLTEWISDFTFTLGVAAVENHDYRDRRLRFVREALERFPNEDPDVLIDLESAKAASLWALGERNEAETTYVELVKRFPDFAWAAINWAAEYWVWDDRPCEFEKAELILTRALARPKLKNRADLLEHLGDLYRAWDKPELVARFEEEYELAAARERREELEREEDEFEAHDAHGDYLPLKAATPLRMVAKIGRNAPCWCGSGKKYKKCHLISDESGLTSPPVS